jgi:hypothetical protein
MIMAKSFIVCHAKVPGGECGKKDEDADLGVLQDRLEHEGWARHRDEWRCPKHAGKP